MARGEVLLLLLACVLVCTAVRSPHDEAAAKWPQGQTLVYSGPKARVYNPSLGSETNWYMNDHTFILGPGGVWHLFGITHTEPADPEFEANFGHAISVNVSGVHFFKVPFALGTVNPPETHLWAPHVVLHNGTYHMLYCGGGASRTQYLIRLAVSQDLYHWERVGTLFTGGVDGRDPMAMRLPSERGGGWAVYYTATMPDSLDSPVTHVTLYRTSPDLRTWSDPVVAFDGGSDGNNFGGPTESPFVVRRGPHYYLFSGAWDFNYTATRVFYSTDPSHFGSVPKGTAVQVGSINSHAPEVVRDIDGTWYVSSAGWGQGGVYLEHLTWQDGCNSCDTSMPIPKAPPAQPPNFRTNLPGPVHQILGQWVLTPSGLQGGSALQTSFYVPSWKSTTSNNMRCEWDVALTTTNGNPSSSPNEWTRTGSSALFGFRLMAQTSPANGGYLLNITTAGGGGVSLVSLPEGNVLASTPMAVEATVTYHVSLMASGSLLQAAVNKKGESQKTQVVVKDTAWTEGWVGLRVEYASITLQNVFCTNSN